jgi:hypothetical protein
MAMDEPVLLNHSGLHASVLPILDRHGAQSRLVVVKATYAIGAGGRLKLAEAQRDVRLGDEPWGAPEVPDLRLPGDFCAAKPGTDFILSGHAVPRRPGADTSVDVDIRVGDRAKVMRVHGPREWRRSGPGVVPGPSAPITSTPLAWSAAYGGSDFSDPEQPLEDPRNPVGSGIARDVTRLIGRPAPQIEAPGSPIGAAGGRFTPIGCAPLGPGFAPRRDVMGTYDKAWLASRYPARPDDYREEHENCAPPDFVFREPLRGGEPVFVTGVQAAGPLAFNLPKQRIVVDADIDGAVVERRPHLDTVVVDSDALVLELVWRALFRCPGKMYKRFTVVRVQAKEFSN